MEEQIRTEHERRISRNEAFIEDIRTMLANMVNKIDALTKNMWIGVGILVALNFMLNSTVVQKVLAAITETAYAIIIQ